MKKTKFKSWNVIRVLLAIIGVFGVGYAMASGNTVADVNALLGNSDSGFSGASLMPAMAIGGAILTPEEITNTLKSISDAQDRYIKAVDDKADKSVLKALEDDLAKYKNIDFAAMKKALEDQGEALAIMKKEAGDRKPSFKTLEGAMAHAILEKKEEFDAIVKNNGKQSATLEINVKAAVTMGEDNTIGAGSTQVLLTQNTGTISTIRHRELRYQAAVSVGNIGTERALWVEETDEQGTPIFLGEGDTKTPLSVLYVEKTESVKKIAVYGKITTELMADLPQLVSYIQNNLMKRLDIKVEDKLFTATGTGDDPKGIQYYATPFAAGDLANAIVDANELDVMEAIALQVKLAFGNPTTLFVHPTTMSQIKLIKDTTGRPVWKDYVTTNGMMNVSGLNIVETTAIDAGDFVGGDTSVVNLLIREALNVKIGLDGNDFINNKKTMLIEKRLVQFVSANDTKVLVKGDFSTAKAAIDAP